METSNGMTMRRSLWLMLCLLYVRWLNFWAEFSGNLSMDILSAARWFHETGLSWSMALKLSKAAERWAERGLACGKRGKEVLDYVQRKAK